MSRPGRTLSIVLVGVATGIVLVAWLGLRGRPDTPSATAGRSLPAAPPPSGSVSRDPVTAGSGGPSAPSADVAGPAGPSGALEPDPDFESALRWSAVDLDAVRAALPENLYWEMSVPTDDPAVVAWREAERARWNREFGKVLSGTATAEEVDAYYALRRRISEDAIDFADYLLEHYGDVLPERDVGLLELAGRLHRARLEAMPRRLAEAHERRLEHERVRAAWLADEAAFDPEAPPTDFDPEAPPTEE
jgi:hypothetical protein